MRRFRVALRAGPLRVAIRLTGIDIFLSPVADPARRRAISCDQGWFAVTCGEDRLYPPDPFRQ